MKNYELVKSLTKSSEVKNEPVSVMDLLTTNAYAPTVEQSNLHK